MAWGSQGTVFLGEDLLHTKDYSDETSRVIDEEVEHILRAQEARATDELRRYRKGLDAVAAALLEHETIDGAEVKRLVDDASGREVHHYQDSEVVPHFDEANGSSEPAAPEAETSPRVDDETQVLDR